MIQRNEIRVGNWVNDAFVGYMQVSPEDFPSWEAINCLPIPLTPGILDKCGFAHVNGVWWHEHSGIMLRPYQGKFLFRYNLLTDGVIFGELHQIQNLYFALTGTELEIKL